MRVFGRRLLLLIGLTSAIICARAADLNSIGVTFLRSLDPSLIGSGVPVLQAEASVSSTDPNLCEINPGVVGQPVSLFTWVSSSGTATTFPNAVGGESFHANEVGNSFFGLSSGVAPGVQHVDNYEAGFFYNSRVVSQTAVTPKIVNQSFIFIGQSTTYDTAYDNYAARYNTLFVSGAGNSGTISPPATCYNGLGVAAYGGSSATAPTPDGRSKPDITAPASLTSFSTPLVSGAAAILLQAGNRNDGGPSTATRATDIRTLKALLLNGAEKPADWMQVAPAPLDVRYGAGVLNVWNSYRQLRGGRQAFIASTSNGLGGSHLPPNNTNNLPTRRGWDQNTIANSLATELVNHYFVDLRSASNRTFTLKSTLVWNRQQNQSEINDLDLFIYDAVSNTLIAASRSALDNVEHLYVTNLPPSRYDIQVLKNGGVTKRITSSETYALAFEFGPPEEARIINVSDNFAQFQGKVVGEPNQHYAIDRSANLISWTPMVTNLTSAAGVFNFSDDGSLNHQFYRTRLVP